MSVEAAAASTHRTCRHLVYRMTCEEYDALVARAGGRCERCRTREEDTRRGALVIDHDHHLGSDAVRGLLCSTCNTYMAKVDAGEVPIDALTAAYLQLSRAGRTPRPAGAVAEKANNRMIRIDESVWERFGQIVGARGRSADINTYLMWRLENPAASLGDVAPNRIHHVLVTVREAPSGCAVEVGSMYGGAEVRERVERAVEREFGVAETIEF